MEPARLVNKLCGIASNSNEALIPSTFKGEENEIWQKMFPRHEISPDKSAQGRRKRATKKRQEQKLFHIAD